MTDTAGIVSECLFPFTIRLLDENSMYVDFYYKAPTLRSLAGIMLFLLFTLLFLQYRRFSLKQNWLEFAVVLVSGIFGFLAIVLIPPLRDKFHR